jgi:ribosomal subunit interface protein
MRTEVSILHNDYPMDLSELVEGKLRALQRFAHEKVSLRALLERQRGTHRVEIIATVPRGQVLVADARADVVGGALDEALARMARLLKRSRQRRVSRARRRRSPRSSE